MRQAALSLMLVVFSMVAMAAQAENTWKDNAKDAWIDGKVETTLLLNNNLNSFTIDTDVKNGVVTLSGEVDTSVDKALASELVVSLDGVKEVINKITVKNKEQANSKFIQGLKDAKVATVVKTRLLLESAVSGSDIDVDVNNGLVTLTGKVKSDAERDLAMQIAVNTTDAKKIVNKIKIQ